jgi:sugar (pentulose or hexulose) kinase
MPGGAFAAGGRAMDWWADIGAQGDLGRALQLAASAPPGAGGLVCLPFLAGERAPLQPGSIDSSRGISSA